MIYKSLCALFLLVCLSSASALSPAGRNLPSSASTLQDEQLQYNQPQYGHRDHDRDRDRSRPRVYNQYYYPYYSSPYYGAPYYQQGYSYGYYGSQPIREPGDAFPDAARADALFDQLSE